MKTFVALFLSTISVAIIGCDKPSDTTTTNAAITTNADNTRLNARDDAGSLTPMDQGNGAADIATTQSIRKALMADDSLSTDAKNVKVITNNGTITLRGPVKSDAEKSNVEAKATAAAGANHVVDQLDVASNK